ncbi:MAG TPA: hypothetical protein VK932_06225 [Kofleriaceae bacterium]|nr:hypothetical protein [Kofleriaceae bacterium]
MSGLTARLATPVEPVLGEIAAYPTALAWSPGGDRLAVAGDDGAIVLLSPGGAADRRIGAHVGPVQSIAWRPRSEELLSTGQDGAVRLWHPPYTSATRLVDPGGAWADAACWSADGTQAAVAIGTRARVLSVGGSSVVTGPVESTIAALGFSPRGKRLGVACYGGVRLFEPATGRLTRRLDRKGSMISLAFSPDGGVVACGCQDRSVHFWRIASGKDARMSGYPAKPRCVAFTHDGRWLATSGDATLCLWPFDRKGPEGRTPIELAGHAALVTALACAPHADLLLSGDRAGVVAMWAPPAVTSPVWLARLSGKVTHVAWGADATAGVLRWAAADDRGRLLIGAL